MGEWSMMDREQRHEQQQHFPGQTTDPHGANSMQWQINGIYNNSSPRLPSPAQDYSNYGVSGLPVDPVYGATTQHTRPTNQRLEPLIMPQWPSMLTSKSTFSAPIYSSAPMTIPPPSTPISASSSKPPSTPRKMLTDDDRRRMCIYHEENPTVKQTEIGGIFGVERSTVSKVLRQKEKYLNLEERSRSPMKRPKGKFPDVERALANWAKNHVRQGLPLSDATIQEQARVFASTVNHSEGQSKMLSSSWLEKFKQKYGIESKSRKNSMTAVEANESPIAEGDRRYEDASPLSPTSMTAPRLPALAAKEEDYRVNEIHEYSLNSMRQPFRTERNSSISSAVFSDTAVPFVADNNNATSIDSPLSEQRASLGGIGMREESGHMDMTDGSTASSMRDYTNGSTIPSVSAAMGPTAAVGNSDGSNRIRPTVMSTTPEISLQTSMPPPPRTSLAVSDTTPLSPSSGGGLSATRCMTPGSSVSPSSPSQDDARKALELVIDYCQNELSGMLEPQDYVTIGRLMEKLNLHRQGMTGGGFGLGLSVSPNSEQLPGGMIEVRRMDGA